MHKIGNNKPSMPIYILALTFVQLIITLPNLPILNIAPINLFVLLLAIILIFRFKEIIKLRANVIIMLLCMAMFSMIDVLFSIYVNGEVSKVGLYGRGLVILASTAVVVKSERDLRVLLKWTILSLFVSSVMGLLIHYYGGVFIEVKNWLLQDSVSQLGSGGQGVWVSGLSAKHFGFGYLLAAAAILTLMFTVESKIKILWWFILAVFIIASILNAERSAVIAMIGGSIYFVMKIGINKNKSLILLIVTGVMIAIVMEGYRHVAVKYFDSQAATALERFRQSDDAFDRLKWQYFGIKSVIQYPVTGATEKQYRRIVKGSAVTSGLSFIPYPHNHYINIGMHIGIIGWILFIVFLINLIRVLKYTNRIILNTDANKTLYTFNKGIHIALGATMFNALFHNNGVFFFEPMTTILLSLTIGVVNVLAYKMGTRTPSEV